MKKRVTLLTMTVALGGLVLAGCASTQPAGEAGAKKYQQDREYMAAIEGAAKRMPLTIIWVNPPQKKAESSDN